MKKNRIFIYSIILIGIISCKKDNDDFGINNSSLDFQMNDFSQFEKKLFDSLDFNKTNTYENLLNENKPIEDDEGNLSIVDINYDIILYPNPFQDIVNLSFSYPRSIINTIIVNNKYEKIIESRSLKNLKVAYHLTDKPSGFYRLYFVLQDSNYNILEYGKVNIHKK
ncbi:hypothetical protein QVZ41_08410 [Wenyingzhuangia sp. chi5]|uniref:Secretion system C-terminal sorting domain-containing protein n=1 Tax=Wenyingzhuangia gilva TaxID=3057677 RepID=A0ABT8VSA8_9FLAO|nr:hypothetical protein [Wenyingzhuangia sp. chi5]MDO3694864.1 hypothetical protein [Wenyingzhuangia sp. chi5]